MTRYRRLIELLVMIRLHRLNNKEFFLNAELIRSIEACPDTIITLRENDAKIMVRETPDEVVNLVTEYRRRCFFEVLETVRADS